MRQLQLPTTDWSTVSDPVLNPVESLLADNWITVNSNCGTGLGGFQPGNTCAVGSGRAEPSHPKIMTSYDNYEKKEYIIDVSWAGDSGKSFGKPPGGKVLPGSTAKTDHRVDTIMDKAIRTTKAPNVKQLVKDISAGRHPDAVEGLEKWSKGAIDKIAQETGIDRNKVLQVFKTSVRMNNNDASAASLHRAVHEELGAPMSEHQLSKESNMLAGKSALGTNITAGRTVVDQNTAKTPRDVERAVVRAAYNYTQQILKEVGYDPEDTITIYRGVRSDNPAIKGQELNLTSSAIESWALHSNVADYFGNPNNWKVYGTNQNTQLHGFTVAVKVPVKRILSVPGGLGDAAVGEVIFIGGHDDKGKIIRTW